MKSVSSVLIKNWGPSPALLRGAGEIGAPPQPSPVGRERLARWELAEFKSLVMRVCRFRDIRPSRRDDPYYRNVPEGIL